MYKRQRIRGERSPVAVEKTAYLRTMTLWRDEYLNWISLYFDCRILLRRVLPTINRFVWPEPRQSAS